MKTDTTIPPPAIETGWRDIASAPKDGTRILLGWVNGDRPGRWVLAWWDDSLYLVGFPATEQGGWTDGGRAGVDFEAPREFTNPTHFRYIEGPKAS